MYDTGGAVGGIARVNWLEDVAPDELIATAGALVAGQNSRDCVQVFVTGSNGRYVAESFSPAGRRIHFCGHGALAAAWVVFDQYESAATALDFVNKIDSVLNFNFGASDGIDSEIEALIAKRTEARQNKDFAMADQIRDQLLEQGIVLEDSAQGVKWKRKI